MVVVSGSAVAVGSFVLLAAGGAGIYGFLKWFNGGEDFPKLEASKLGSESGPMNTGTP